MIPPSGKTGEEPGHIADTAAGQAAYFPDDINLSIVNMGRHSSINGEVSVNISA